MATKKPTKKKTTKTTVKSKVKTPVKRVRPSRAKTKTFVEKPKFVEKPEVKMPKDHLANVDTALANISELESTVTDNYQTEATVMAALFGAASIASILYAAIEGPSVVSITFAGLFAISSLILAHVADKAGK